MTKLKHLLTATLALAALAIVSAPPKAKAQTILRLDGSDFFEASFWNAANANSLITGLNTYGTEILNPGRGGTGNAFTRFIGPDNAVRTFTLPDQSATLTHTGNPLSVFAATTSAQLAGVLSDETGSGGGFVRAQSPTLSTPNLGAATASSINGLTINTTTGTLAIANGKTATANNTLTLQGTDGSTVSFGGGGTVAYTGNNLSAFASTTSAQLAGVISNETGTGQLVFNTSPNFSGTVAAANLWVTGNEKDSFGQNGQKNQVKAIGDNGLTQYVLRTYPIWNGPGVNSGGGEFTSMFTVPVGANLLNSTNQSIAARFDLKTSSSGNAKAFKVNVSGNTVFETPPIGGGADYFYRVAVEVIYVDSGVSRVVVNVTSNNPAQPALVGVAEYVPTDWNSGFDLLIVSDTVDGGDLIAGTGKVEFNP